MGTWVASSARRASITTRPSSASSIALAAGGAQSWGLRGGGSPAAFAGAGQAVEVDLVQQHRVDGDQFLALQPVQAEARQLGRIARGQVGVDGVQPSHRAAVVVDVMAADQIAGQALQSDWFEGDGSRVILHYLLV